MKLEVGMYVRTKQNGIIKINEVIDNGVITYEDDLGREWEEETGRKVIRYIGKDGWNCGIDENEILKASHTLLGNDEEPCLIEVGDVIIDKAGYKYPINYEFETAYNDEYESYEITIDDHITLFLKDGLSIATREMFESISYKVGD